MLTKKQPSESSSNNQAGKKIWMWIFIAMFALPEILFSFVLSLLDFWGKHITPMYSFFVPYHFFIDHPTYLLVIEIVEWIGVFGLFVISIKNKKIIFIVLLGAILAWLSINLGMGYIISNMRLGL